MVASPDKHYQARILERRDLSNDLWIVRIDPGGPFEFRAGQYATLGVEHDGKRIERAYSIVSSPYEESLEFFVELVPQGGLTPDLFKLKKSDTLLCRKIAKGRFTLDLRSGRTHHLLVSTVTGIAPFVSYIRTLYRDSKNGASPMPGDHKLRSEEHTSELQSQSNLVCRLLLEKKKLNLTATSYAILTYIISLLLHF